MPCCDDDVACFCIVGLIAAELRVRVHRQACRRALGQVMLSCPPFCPLPIRGEGVNEKFASIVLSYRRDTTGVPSINGNQDCKMTMLATAPGTLLDSSLWRIYEEVVFSHGSTRGIDLAVFPPSANSAFNKRSKAF